MARSVLDRNRRVGASQLPPIAYDYTCPSQQTYPFQWNWDSAFHAIALARFDPVRAQAEINTLLAARQPSGFLPHMVLWQDEFRARASSEFTVVVGSAGWYSLTTQPPVVPFAVERVWLANGDEQWLDHVLPALVDIDVLVAYSARHSADRFREHVPARRVGVGHEPEVRRCAWHPPSNAGQRSLRALAPGDA